MGVKENWWRLNYHTVRLVAVPVVKKLLRVKVVHEGELPNIRPLFIAPVHRTSVDMYVIANGIGEFISYVSTDAFGHSKLVNFLQRQATRFLGSVIWQESGIANTRQRAVVLAQDVEDKLDRRLIVAAFTQGEFQYDAVDSVEEGLIGLLRRYEARHLRDKGHELKIPIVPVGIEYQYGKKGLVLSRFFGWMIRHVPYFPNWAIPAFGSKIVVKFGEPQYFDGRGAKVLTHIVMREAARLSNIPFNVESVPTASPDPAETAPEKAN
jgi:hypothetical protein